MDIVNHSLIEKTLEKARASPRRRAITSLHASPEGMQRMVNALLRGTYVRPHVHEKKREVFFHLQGKVAVLVFDDQGNVTKKVMLGDGMKVVDIPPRTWHSLVCVSEEGVVFEVKDGPYDPQTDKVFPSWAPEEDSPKAGEYCDSLVSQCE